MSSPTIPDNDPANAVVSPAGIIHVLGYSPAEGDRGVPITVRIHFQPELADAMYVRLVVGHKAVATKVRELAGIEYGRWELDALAPPFEHEQFSSPKVLVSVQALNDENTILDSVVFGEFSYWSPTCTPDRLTAQLPSAKLSQEPIATRRRGATLSHLPSSAAERASLVQPKLRIHRRVKTQSIVRSKHSSLPNDHSKLVAHTPVLELITPLSTICTGWSQAEYNAGRRLVRFSKVQDGRKLIVSCEPIRQEDFCETDTVISCIYREEVDSCFITSVDVIYLLERLTNGEFPVEEKNRIRRNLEGLRPTTVSKHKPGFGDFFQRIMEFPDPKPRNIEKDLKVFDWNLLGQALEKILSKYSIYVSADEDAQSLSSSSASPVSEPSPLDSPELVTTQLSYPSPIVPLPTKYDSPFNDAQLLPDGQPDAFMSPVDSSNTSSSSTVFPPFAASEALNTTVNADDIMSAAWQTGLKANGIPVESLVLSSYNDDMGNMGSLDVGQGYAQDDDSLNFNLYENFAFSTMGEENLVDHHQYV